MAHTFDTSALLVDSTATSITLAYTTGVDATALVLSIMTAGSTARVTTAPTFNGLPFGQVGSTQAGSGGTILARHEMWVLCNVLGGITSNIVVPNTGALTITLVASSYSATPGLDSIASTAVQASANGANPSVSLPNTNAGNALVSGVCGGIGTPTAGTGLTALYMGSAATIGYGSEYLLQTGSGTVAMNYTATANRWASHAVILAEVPRNVNRTMMGFGV